MMNKSQQFGFLLLELICAVSLFMLAGSAVGCFLVQLAQYQKTVEARYSFLAGVTQLLETGAAAEGLIVTEEKREPIMVAARPFHVATLAIKKADYQLIVKQCVP
ncbi:hypothetical protein FJ365_05675 [Candidatus Dependentiae bacterium]|nr:hypothetical protein [Candidatus Dependentiae bacterium]